MNSRRPVRLNEVKADEYQLEMEASVAVLTPATDLAATNPVRHPNESEEYRRARQELLVEEIELRRQPSASRRSAASAARRRSARDYRFVAEDGSDVSLSDLFGDHDTLIVYSYMFGPERDAPCPMCTSLMGGLDHKIADIRQRVAIAFTARSPIERLVEAKRRVDGRSAGVQRRQGDYTRDYVSAEDADMPAYNVFTRRDGEIRHFWSDEMTGDMADPGQDPRGAVEMDPLWLLLDTSPRVAAPIGIPS